MKKLIKKTDKVSTRSKLVINFPEVFTVSDIKKQHPESVEITLRFRINKAVEDGKVVAIAKIPRQIGRPALVYATAPVTQEKRDAAVAMGGQNLDEFMTPSTSVKVDAPATPVVETTTVAPVSEVVVSASV
jgi:hypothetical protein